MKKTITFVCILINFLKCSGENFLEIKKKSSQISIIIPCHYKHAIYLDNLISSYENQSQLPDEVVVSISEAGKIPPSVISNLRKKPWAFPVKILISNQVLYAGQNRNKACQHASGTIFICQDADDVPHPQRVEIISYFFEKFNIHHLIHTYVGPSDFQQFKAIENIPSIYPNTYNEIKFSGIHNGNIAISKELFLNIKWGNERRGQDTYFNIRVYQSSYKHYCLFVKASLIIYRSFLSSTKTTSTYRSNQIFPKLFLPVIIDENEEFY